MIEVNEQLAYIKHFLKKEKPSIADVVECYLTAADLYLQLEDADKVIECLTATEKPMFSYNNGVLFGEYTPQQIDPNSILNEMNANLYRYEQLSVEQRNELKNLGFLSFAKKKELRVEIEKLEAQLIRYKTENYPTSLKMAFENMYMDTN